MRNSLLCLFILVVVLFQCTFVLAQKADLPWNLVIKDKFICDYSDCMDQDTIFTSGKCVRMVDKYIDMSSELPTCIDSFESSDEDTVRNELYCYANTRMVEMSCDELFDPAIDVNGVIDMTNGTSDYEVCLFNMMAIYDGCIISRDFNCFLSCSDAINKPCYDDYEITQDTDALSECLDQVQGEITLCDEERCHDHYFEYPPEWFPTVIE